MKSKKKSSEPTEGAPVAPQPKSKKVKEKKKSKKEKKEEQAQNIPLTEPAVVMRPAKRNNPPNPGYSVNRRKTVNPVTQQATKMIKAIKGDLNDGGTCVKFMLIFYNVFVLLAGAAVLSTSVWMSVARGHISVITGNMLFTVANYIMVAGGAIMIILAVLGMFAAICQSRGLLLFYSIAAVVVIIVLVVSGIIAVVYPTKLDERNKENMQIFLRDGYGVHLYQDYNRAMTEAWDKVQDELHCCAVLENNWSVYRASQWYQRQGGIEGVTRPYVPLSCCVREYPSGLYRSVQLCQTWKWGPPGQDSGVNWSVYHKGCYDASNEYIQGHIQILLGLGIGFGLSLVLGIVLAISLFRQLNPERHGNGA